MLVVAYFETEGVFIYIDDTLLLPVLDNGSDL